MTDQKTKILLVEDDSFLVDMYVAKFKELDWDVQVAFNGEEALEHAKSMHPNLILLDVRLPKMTGFEVMQAMQQDESLKTIPVIFLTNLGQKEEIRQGLQMGAAGYLIKAHFTPQEVVEKVEETLSKVNGSSQ